MPALDWITVEGFRSIDKIEKLALTPINVLIGANGSGKSNFINVFSFLREVRDGRLQQYVATAGGADRLLHFGSKYTDRMTIHLSFAKETNQYKIVLSAGEADVLIPLSETAYYWDKNRYQKPYETSLHGSVQEAGISRPQTAPIAKYVQGHLDRWRVYHFHDTSSSAALKKTANINDNRYLRADGSNLPAFLYMLKESYPGDYLLIRSVIQRVAPFFEDFSLSPSNLNKDTIRLEWKHKGTDAFFDVSSLSDGTIRFMALATLFLQPAEFRPSVILVDEPELGLHPYAITMLAAMVKQASVKTQVIISTQSSFLLDNFEPNDVLVADRVAGGTVMSRLKNEDLRTWLEKYSLGQLWEAGEFNGRPNLET
jgi:predicted ATPase